LIGREGQGASAAGTSVGRRRASVRLVRRVEMRSGIHGIVRPDFFPVLVESDPFAVADAVGAREDFGMAAGGQLPHMRPDV
jgi:hypothetical protein